MAEPDTLGVYQHAEIANRMSGVMLPQLILLDISLQYPFSTTREMLEICSME